MNNDIKTAEARGMEMMNLPMNSLPPVALAFAKKLCDEVGMCMEVLLTAWTAYAQCVENLPCSDSLYKVRPQDVEWFKQRATAVEQAEPVPERMTILALHRILSGAIASGYGDGPVYFDTEARQFDCHLVEVDRASIEDDPDLISITGKCIYGFAVLTTRFH